MLPCRKKLLADYTVSDDRSIIVVDTAQPVSIETSMPVVLVRDDAVSVVVAGADTAVATVEQELRSVVETVERTVVSVGEPGPAGPAGAAGPAGSSALPDTDASHTLSLAAGSNLTANRTLTLTTGDADREITLSGNPTLDDWFDQSVKMFAQPSFLGLSVSSAGLSVTGPTILGGPAGGTLELYTDVITIGNNYTATRSAGTVAPGVVTNIENYVNYTGDAGGTSNVRPFQFSTYVLGGNPVAVSHALLTLDVHNGTNTVAVRNGFVSYQATINSGAVTTSRGFVGQVSLDSVANVSTHDFFVADPPLFNSTGVITTAVGFKARNLGNAKVTNAYGLRIDDFTNATGAMRGVFSSLSSGTGKHNVYADGTAPNYFNGPILKGVTSVFNTIGGFAVDHYVASGTGYSVTQRSAADAFPSSLELLKTRNTTPGAHTIVQNGDQIGSIRFGGSDGSAFMAAASIYGVVDNTPGTNDMPGALEFRTTPDGSVTPVSRVKIDSLGNTILNNSGSSLATTATGGFAYIPSCAGTPTGVPTRLPTGAVAAVWDSTNHVLNVYSGAAWRGATTPGVFV